MQHRSDCNLTEIGISLGITFMGDFQLVLNLKLFEVGPHGQEMHLSLLCSAHLRESLDWKLASLGRTMQGWRSKLLFLLTSLKCKSHHCSKQLPISLSMAAKVLLKMAYIGLMCSSSPVTSFSIFLLLLSLFQLHWSTCYSTGYPLIPRHHMANSFTSFDLCSTVTFSMESTLTALFHIPTHPPCPYYSFLSMVLSTSLQLIVYLYLMSISPTKAGIFVCLLIIAFLAFRRIIGFLSIFLWNM